MTAEDDRELVAAFRWLGGAVRREPILVGAVVFLAALNITALFMLNGIVEDVHSQNSRITLLAEQNRQVLAVQVPTLRDRIAERDQTISDLSDVNEQAIGWIIKLTEQIEELGGEPPKIVLKPSQLEKEGP